MTFDRKRYSSLIRKSSRLIKDGKREDRDVTALLVALEEFTTGKKVTLFARYSLPIQAVGLHEEDMEFLQNSGVRFVGEASYMIGFDSSYKKQRLQQALGLPKDADPIAEGWHPPYWDDERFTALLNTPCVDYFGERVPKNRSPDDRWIEGSFVKSRTAARRSHYEGVHYMAQYLRDYRARHRWSGKDKWRAHDMSRLQRCLRNDAGGDILWPMAFIPKDWKPSRLIPDAWRREEEKIAEEIAHFEVPKAWIVKWSDFDAPTIEPCWIRNPKMEWEDESGRFRFINGKVTMWVGGFGPSELELEVDGKCGSIGSYGRAAQAFSTKKKALAFKAELEAKRTSE